MERRFEWDVDSESVGMRVDKYISGCSLGLTRSAAENLAAKGLILKMCIRDSPEGESCKPRRARHEGTARFY